MGFLQVPKISTLERLSFTPYKSELIYDTDLDIIFTGDGLTVGGNKVGALSEDSLYLKSYATEAALNTAHPTAISGNYALVQSTDTVWVWDADTTAWVDSGDELSSIPLNSVGLLELKNEVKGNILFKDNTVTYVPTANYHPATKKYIDDAIAAGVADNSVTAAKLAPAFKTIIDLGDVSGTVNLDFSLAVKYKLNMTANITLTFSNVTDYVGVKTQQLEVTSNSDTYTLFYPVGVDAANELTDVDLLKTNYFTFFPHTATVFQSSVIAK